MKVHIKDIVDALEVLSDGYLAFVDLDTGEVVSVSRELLGEAEECEEDEEDEEPESLPDWQVPEWEAARKIAYSDRFRKLPTKFDVNDWSIMEEFAESLRPGRIQDDLDYAIHGTGAFRSFKHAVRRHGIEQAWFAFRAKALREIAIDWCEEHGIEWK